MSGPINLVKSPQLEKSYGPGEGRHHDHSVKWTQCHTAFETCINTQFGAAQPWPDNPLSAGAEVNAETHWSKL